MIGRVTGAAAGAIGTAFASALCCAGPLVAVSLGVSGAGIASTFEPLRPYFLAGTGLFLAVGHLGFRGDVRGSCDDGGSSCAGPEAHRRRKVLLWLATGLAIVLAAYPTWSAWVL